MVGGTQWTNLSQQISRFFDSDAVAAELCESSFQDAGFNMASRATMVCGAGFEDLEIRTSGWMIDNTEM